MDFVFPEKFVKWVGYTLILFGIITLIDVLPQVFTLRTFINNLSEIRTAYYGGDSIAETSSSYINILANWVRYIQFFSPCFAFLNLIKGNNITAILLFVVSLVPALSNLLIGEREACVVLISNFIFSYIFFRPILSDRLVSVIKRIGLCFTAPFVIFIIAMTISRFGDSDGGVGSGLLKYLGEQPFNFSYFFTHLNISQQCLGGKLTFGYLFPESEQIVGPTNDYIYADEFLNVFAGIPGSLILDFAYMTIFVIGLIVLLFMNKFSQKRNCKTGKYDFSVFMAFYIYYQLIFMGLFYYDFRSKYLIVMCLFLFVFHFIIKNVFKFKKSMI